MDFRPITIDDRQQFYKLMSKENSLETEASFSTYLIWSKPWQIEVSIQDEGMYFKGCYNGSCFYMPPLLKNIKYAEMAINNMLSQCKKGMLGIKMISESLYQALPEYLQKMAKEERDDFDYVYLAEDLINLKGKKYHPKRTHVNKFNTLYQYTYEEITKDNINLCLEVEQDWLDKHSDYNTALLEYQAVSTALNNLEQLNLKGLMIKVDNKVIAFSIVEKANSELGIVHFEKAMTDYQGVYATINQLTASTLLNDVKYISRQEDMGLEGLRKSKLSYHPYMLLKKWSININD